MLLRALGRAAQEVAQLLVEGDGLVDHPFAEGPEEQPILVQLMVDRCLHGGRSAGSRLTAGTVRVSRRRAQANVPMTLNRHKRRKVTV